MLDKHLQMSKIIKKLQCRKNRRENADKRALVILSEFDFIKITVSPKLENIQQLVIFYRDNVCFITWYI